MKYTSVAILAACASGANAALTFTAGNTQSLTANAAVAYTGTTGSNWICWKAHTAASAIAATDCPASAGTETAFGVANAVKCGGAGITDSITWDDVTATHISLIECSGEDLGGTPVPIVLSAATAMTGTATSTLNTLVAGETPTSVAIALTPTTIVPDGGKITCTYAQDVFAAVAAVTCAADPVTVGIACAATSTKIVEFTAGSGTFLAASTSFAMTSNLAANYATGAVGVTCVSTTDTADLTNAASFTTTAATTGAPTAATTAPTAAAASSASTVAVATGAVCLTAASLALLF
jgi:hypothetical protein